MPEREKLRDNFTESYFLNLSVVDCHGYWQISSISYNEQKYVSGTSNKFFKSKGTRTKRLETSLH